MSFMECLMACAENKELVQEFDRLVGCNLSFAGHPIDRMIDESTGKLADDLQKFIKFVWDCVWIRLPPCDAAFCGCSDGTTAK